MTQCPTCRGIKTHASKRRVSNFRRPVLGGKLCRRHNQDRRVRFIDAMRRTARYEMRAQRRADTRERREKVAE